jgi:hypothetical protein
MNLYTVLTATYYIQIHKLTTLEHHNTTIMNWQRTLKCPAQNVSPSRLIAIYPHVIRHNNISNSPVAHIVTCRMTLSCLLQAYQGGEQSPDRYGILQNFRCQMKLACLMQGEKCEF